MEANGEVGWKRWRVTCACVCVCVYEWASASGYVTRGRGCRGNSAEARSLCDPLCLSHTQTHPRCDCTQALDALLRMAGRGHSIRDKENKWEESEVVLCTFFSVQRWDHIMQNDDICLSQHCSNIDSFPEWIFYSYTFWLCNAASATVGEPCNSLGLVAHRPEWCCVGFHVMGQTGPSCGPQTINTPLWSALHIGTSRK